MGGGDGIQFFMEQNEASSELDTGPKSKALSSKVKYPDLCHSSASHHQDNMELLNLKPSGEVVPKLAWGRHMYDLDQTSAEVADKSQLFFRRIQLQNDLILKSINSLTDKREKLRRYRPGDGILEVGGITKNGFAIPKVSTLLLVGPSGAGKSSVINNMIRVLDDRTSGFDRAQVYEEKGNGSLFLQEYSLYKDANNFSVFDSRGFSEDNIAEDLASLKEWMTHGVCHGEPVCRPSDTKLIKEAIEGRGREGHFHRAAKRRVDFVIFVVDALAVHQMKERHDVVAVEKLALLYKSPFLSFKDDRPIVVMTHGDKLSSQDRMLTRIFIGEVFGVSPVDQVFDISCFTERILHPGDEDVANDLVLLNMLDLALERADRNFPYKDSSILWLQRVSDIIKYQWSTLDEHQKLLLMAVAAVWLFCLVLLLVKLLHHGWKIRPLLHLGRKPSFKWEKQFGKLLRRLHF